MLYLDRDYSHLCPQCRYPLLGLRDFQGVSSANNTDLIRMGMWRALGHSLQMSRRRKKVMRLRKTILTAFPWSQICPQCLHVVERI